MALVRRFDYENRSRVFLGMNPWEWRAFFVMLVVTVAFVGSFAWACSA